MAPNDTRYGSSIWKAFRWPQRSPNRVQIYLITVKISRSVVCLLLLADAQARIFRNLSLSSPVRIIYVSQRLPHILRSFIHTLLLR